MSPRTLFTSVAVAEAVTWALLIAGMLQKYVFEAGEWGVSIGGGVHGLVFLLYCATAVLVAVNQRWSVGVTVVALASAVVPFATIPTELVFRRTGRLDGRWRTAATEHPRDSLWLDRLVRWWLRRPALLIALVGIAVVGVFVTLLTVGPPGGESA